MPAWIDALDEKQSEAGDTVAENRDTAVDIEARRHLNRARAALREAAEHLEDAASAAEHPSVSVAAALSHVGSARRAIRPYELGSDGEAAKADAA